jgi:hypothetical protein
MEEFLVVFLAPASDIYNPETRWKSAMDMGGHLYVVLVTFWDAGAGDSDQLEQFVFEISQTLDEPPAVVCVHYCGTMHRNTNGITDT